MLKCLSIAEWCELVFYLLVDPLLRATATVHDNLYLYVCSYAYHSVVSHLALVK